MNLNQDAEEFKRWDAPGPAANEQEPFAFMNLNIRSIKESNTRRIKLNQLGRAIEALPKKPMVITIREANIREEDRK